MSSSRKTDRRGRSKGTLASFVGLEMFILDSPAYDSLSLCARQAYIEVARLYNGKNNGRLVLSARGLAQRLHVSKATASRAMRDLEQRGFVECVKAGGFNLKTGSKRAAEWRMTRYKCDATGAVPSKAFMNWKPGKIHFTVSPEAHSGFTTGPLSAETPPRIAPVGTTRNRNGVSQDQSGFISGPHLDICHTGDASKPAQRGGAARPAQATASVNSGPFQPDTFTDLHGAALRSLAELSETLPAHLQSWAHPKSALSQPSTETSNR